MTDKEIMELATDYMNKRGVDIVLPGKIGVCSGDNIEVIFLNPLALDPDSIVCPPDNRVWINVKNKQITWIEQM